MASKKMNLAHIIIVWNSYGLVYEQFTSLNMHMIQKTIKRVDTHDDEIARLKERVTELQSKLNAYILGEMEIRT